VLWLSLTTKYRTLPSVEYYHVVPGTQCCVSGSERIRIQVLCCKTWIFMFLKLNYICKNINTGFELVENWTSVPKITFLQRWKLLSLW
jgi:hypothetical protein